ncbi:MAG TPA: dihydrolipoamide acetyltransferase family protein [Anaerovoracaceae bacterium]|nr:dihydrolipoamide acetyltransferase family protein [Anaerovoracaceae bacterium]
MAEKLVMPKLGLSMTEGTVIKWHKKEGDAIEKGEGALDIETEKLNFTVEAPASGVLLKILAAEGEVLPIATTLAYIGEAGEKVSETGGPESGRKEDRAVRISPAAKALADKLNLDYSGVTGTGPNGRITKEDIIAYSERPQEISAAPVSQEVPAAPPSQDAAAVGAGADPREHQEQREPQELWEQQDLQGPREQFDILPYAGMRKAIGTNMSLSWSTAPMVTHHVQADVTALLELRKSLNSNLKDGQVKLTVTDMMAKIAAKALKRHPIANSTLAGEKVKLLKDINIGIAVALREGLIVPVVKHADRKDVFAISREIKELSEKAKNRTLEAPDMKGGTFTVTNIGGYGSVDFFTPIINQPESAILGIGRTQQAPAVRDGAIVIRSLMGLSLTFDHRVVDGAPAAEFLATVLELLENPARSIFE